MDDAVLVRELHCARHLSDEPEARLERQLAGPAMLGDRHARDVLHDEVRLSDRRHATVEEGDDVRVLERREDLAFGAKPAGGVARTHGRTGDLDRDPVLEEAIGTLGEVDAAHTPFADEVDETILADRRPDAHSIGCRAALVLVGVAEQGALGSVQEIAESIVRLEQRLDFGAEPRPAAAPGGEERRPRVRGDVGNIPKDGLELGELFA